MGEQHARFRIWIAAAVLVFAAVSASALPGATSAAEPNVYVATNLVSDEPGVAPVLDPDLVNPWGLDALAGSPWWVADNETDVSTLYQANGTKVALTVGIPGGAPTGLVANAGSSFVVTEGALSGVSRFIFATLSGTIQAWTGGLTASVVRATSPDAGVYTGLTIATVGTTPYLYAADFANGRVDVYDGAFALQSWAGAFVDPTLPAGYAPFGIQEQGGTIFVAYAKPGPSGEEQTGPGLGVVSAFGTDGSFQGRIGTGGALDAPWGLAIAPASWGRFAGHLLVGNFGDGRINAFRPTASGWEPSGPLKLANHQPLVIDGLWGISFGKGAANNGPTSTLFFAAGPEDETEGLFGTVTAG